MSPQTETESKRERWQLSIDEWAVAVAMLAALLVRFGVLKHIPW